MSSDLGTDFVTHWWQKFGEESVSASHLRKYGILPKTLHAPAVGRHLNSLVDLPIPLGDGNAVTVRQIYPRSNGTASWWYLEPLT